MVLAQNFAQQAKPGDIICLKGDLGAGKTAFAQGYAKGLGYSGYVTSPTFTLMQIYEGVYKGAYEGAYEGVYKDVKMPIYHFDLYRLMDEGFGLDASLETSRETSLEASLEASLEDIGFFDYLNADGVCLIEWAEYAKAFIPPGAIWIEIRKGNSLDGNEDKNGRENDRGNEREDGRENERIINFSY